jgi:hypothetical protein
MTQIVEQTTGHWFLGKHGSTVHFCRFKHQFHYFKIPELPKSSCIDLRINKGPAFQLKIHQTHAVVVNVVVSNVVMVWVTVRRLRGTAKLVVVALIAAKL